MINNNTLPETRGRKRKKIFALNPGDLQEFDPKEAQALRYAAKKSGWKIRTRTVNGKLIVFREHNP